MKTFETWCVCGRKSDDDSWELAEKGLATQEVAATWLKENWTDLHAQYGWAEFYVDRQANENPADLFATIRGDSLRWTLASGVEVSV